MMISATAILSVTALILFGWSRKCRHQWEVMDEWEMMEGDRKRPVGIQYVQRCTKCGKIKQVTL